MSLPFGPRGPKLWGPTSPLPRTPKRPSGGDRRGTASCERTPEDGDISTHPPPSSLEQPDTDADADGNKRTAVESDSQAPISKRPRL
eukprot:9065722-Pyramimonas_sp.AAC.1